MTLTKDQIIEHALQYISKEEISDFPVLNDLFCFVERDIPDNKVLKDTEGWQFGGYGICKGYTYDYEAKPLGKWVWFSYISLTTFPPLRQVLRLQPPHIAKGLFQNQTRTREIRILKMQEVYIDSDEISTDSIESELSADTDTDQKDTAIPESKLIQFPRKKQR